MTKWGGGAERRDTTLLRKAMALGLDMLQVLGVVGQGRSAKYNAKWPYCKPDRSALKKL